MSCRTLVIAGAASGVGKTTFTASLARALTLRGLRVQTFKCGPDYLDPTYHTQASGRPCHNLDPWMMGEDAVRDTFTLATRDADVAIVEGVMGLFDGRSPENDESSTAHVARLLGAPVLLVADASGMARSFAALVHGYASFDPSVRVVAALANRVGSAGHGALLARALPPDFPLFWLERVNELAFAERHLGLVRASDESAPRLDAWAARLTASFDLDRLLGLFAPLELPAALAPAPVTSRARCRIGIARDAAFHFYYPYNLHLLERAGARLVTFSPLTDTLLPDVDGVIIGGGYPELHTARLGPSTPAGAWLRALAARGAPIYAECGGLMWLARSLTTLDGVSHPMLGLFGGAVQMRAKRQALGYSEVHTTRPSLLGAAGQALYGHEFRYSELTNTAELPCAYTLAGKRGGAARAEGYGAENVLASYVHLHWGRTPEVASHFVAACEAATRAAQGVPSTSAGT